MRWGWKSPSLHFYWLKGSLTSRTISTWYERNWPLMTLYVIHSEEMDSSRAKSYGSDGIHNSVPRVTNPVLYPTELSPHPLDWGGGGIVMRASALSSFSWTLCSSHHLICFMIHGTNCAAGVAVGSAGAVVGVAFVVGEMAAAVVIYSWTLQAL